MALVLAAVAASVAVAPATAALATNSVTYYFNGCTLIWFDIQYSTLGV